MKEILNKTKYLWLGKFKGFGTATFPKTVMPVLLADAHLQQCFKIKNKTNKHTQKENSLEHKLLKQDKSISTPLCSFTYQFNKFLFNQIHINTQKVAAQQSLLLQYTSTNFWLFRKMCFQMLKSYGKISIIHNGSLFCLF